MPTLSMNPIALALVSAALFSGQAVLSRRGLNHLDPQIGSTIAIGTAAAIFWVLAPFSMELAFWRSPALWFFILSGLFQPTLTMWLAFEANRRMGPTLSATISSVTPIFATAGAVAALGETLTWPVFLGTLGTVGGVAIISWSRPGLRSWPLAALGFPLGAALLRSTTFLFGKMGLELLDSPHFAATVSFTVSFGLSLSVFLWRAARGPVPVPLRGVLWCALGGCCVSGAILSMYTAIAGGLVVVVAPLINTYPVFTLILVLAFRQERVGLRVAGGVLLVAAGVALITAR